MVWKLTGFADEISPDLDVQLATLAAESMRFLDLRGVWGKNVLDLSDDELKTFKRQLREAGVQVAAIGSPVGKAPITEDFALQQAAFQRAVAIAQTLGVSYIRIFSFYLPQGADPAPYRDEVLRRLRAFVAATPAGITLILENEVGLYGDIPSRCTDLLKTIDSTVLRAVWDPANYVLLGIRPFTDGFAEQLPYIEFVHVKDAVLGQDKIVPAGQGDGQWAETLAALKAAGFDGYCSLEPHLARGGQMGGFSGPELFHTAAAAFKDLLRAHDIAWQ